MRHRAVHGNPFLPPDIRTGFRVFEDAHASAPSRSSKENVRFAVIYVPHHNFISQSPSRGRGTHDGVPAWPPGVRGTDVLPATDRRHAHPPERVRPERPWTDRDLPRNPVPTRDFGPERPRARALPRDLGRHAGGTREPGWRPRLEAHLRPPEHRPPRVGRPPAHVHLLRLRVDLSRLNQGPESPRRTPGRRSPSCAPTESCPSRRRRRSLSDSPLPDPRRGHG